MLALASYVAWPLRVAVAVVIFWVILRVGVRAMRSYVHGSWAEQEQRQHGPPPTMEVTGEFRLRCAECGFEVQVVRVPETPAGPYELKALRHCREEMAAVSELST